MSEEGPIVESPETVHEKTSRDIEVVIGHLQHNRTTVREAEKIQEAARRSIVDHSIHRSTG